MSRFEPKKIKEAKEYLEWKLEQTKKVYVKESLFKRILKKLFS